MFFLFLKLILKKVFFQKAFFFFFFWIWTKREFFYDFFLVLLLFDTLFHHTWEKTIAWCTKSYRRSFTSAWNRTVCPKREIQTSWSSRLAFFLFVCLFFAERWEFTSQALEKSGPDVNLVR